MMNYKGNVWKFGDNVNTDHIISGRYLNLSDEISLAKHLMEDFRPGLNKQIKKGDIFLAGTNFGCGSCREHAPISIKYAGIDCIVAQSFNRIFFRNSINIGLPIVECDVIYNNVNEGDVISINFSEGIIINESNNKKFIFNVYPGFVQNIMFKGGVSYYLNHEWLDIKKST